MPSRNPALTSVFPWLFPVLLLCASSAPAGRPEGVGEAGSVLQGTGTHWAFQPVVRPEIPSVADSSWAANAIDAFVLAPLEARGIRPSQRADRPALIRRAYFDLIGLPPDRAAVEEFVNDPSPNAFSELVDRLLALPEYGERWGRHWLDVARYSDAKGYVDAGEPRYAFAFTYRDYVIEAFNHDLPFDEFVLEQLAADLLPGAGDTGSLAALGFLTVGSRYNFFPHEIIDDRIDVTARGLLGLSIACARCHDHKFDPVSSEDYYGLYGVFANSQEPTPADAPRLGPPGRAEDARFEEKLRETADKFAKLRSDLLKKIMHEMRAWSGDYLRYVVQSTPEHRTQAQAELRTQRGLIREISAYSKGGAIRWRQFLASRTSDDPVFGLWARIAGLKRGDIVARASGELSEWRDSGRANPIVLAAFAAKEVRTMADVADGYGAVLEETETLWQARMAEEPGASGFEAAAREELRQVLYGPESPATVTLEESENLYTLEESVDARKGFADIERVFLEVWDGVAPRPMLLRDRKKITLPRVFVRGDAQRPGGVVTRRIPALLDGLNTGVANGGSGRLELARAIVDPANPLTARVIVNRVWGWHFGNGLVDTASDFGLRSVAPTHPGLLDFLADWLVQNQWSIKKLHRLILQSSAWQQASIDRPDCRGIDPDNHLLWRMNRRRLEFEEIRDAMLFASGSLERARGGAPVRKAPDDVSHRQRTIYTFLDREHVPELCSVFDFPTPDITAPRRSRTTVPQQSLFLLNNPFVIAQAEAIARGLGVTDKTDSDRCADGIEHLYERVYGRLPAEAEKGLADEFLRSRLRGAEEESRASVLQVWTELAQALLLSNEFLFVD
ncbi:MAG: DUF1549 and DUF1553 domain-containing protein [Verrucomicrobia bacterium]|nr:DUF1549 and DUF1553 domain-containing protein [Verrucomicrobiota bacterium]